MPENIEALKLFDACQTCWKYDFNGLVMGLDYAQVEVVMDKLDFESKMFADLQIMELSVVNHQK